MIHENNKNNKNKEIKESTLNKDKQEKKEIKESTLNKDKQEKKEIKENTLNKDKEENKEIKESILNKDKQENKEIKESTLNKDKEENKEIKESTLNKDKEENKENKENKESILNKDKEENKESFLNKDKEENKKNKESTLNKDKEENKESILNKDKEESTLNQENKEIKENNLSVCLNMIVKNESHIIKDTLTKLCNQINFSYWVICDTGSTDNTPSIILDFFNEKNIKGEIYYDEWVDFAHNRTLALERSYNKSDLLFIFDADDEIIGNFELPQEVLFDEYNLQFGYEIGNINYYRVLLINNRKKFKYKSAVHEYICYNDEGKVKSCMLVGDYCIQSERTGNRNKDPDKYLKDALILEEAYKKEINKPEDEKDMSLIYRYTFYCANSYYNYNNFENAIKWYKLVLTNNKQWEQEKYMACLNIFECYRKLNNPESGFFYLVESFKYDKERVDCLYELVYYYFYTNNYDMAYSYYLVYKDFYENKYLLNNLQLKIFLYHDKIDFLLPYYLIILYDKIKDKIKDKFNDNYDKYNNEFNYIISIGKLFEIIFTKKFYIENNNKLYFDILHNLQFTVKYHIQNPKFVYLLQEYIYFLDKKDIFKDTTLDWNSILKIYEEYNIKLLIV